MGGSSVRDRCRGRGSLPVGRCARLVNVGQLAAPVQALVVAVLGLRIFGGCAPQSAELIIYNRMSQPIAFDTAGTENYVETCSTARFVWASNGLVPVASPPAGARIPDGALRIEIPSEYIPPPDGEGSAVRRLIVTIAGLVTDSPPFVEEAEPSLPSCETSPSFAPS